MSFKDYLEETTFKYKKVKQTINLEEYDTYIKSSKTYNSDKKDFIKTVSSKKEFPIFIESLNKFAMANPKTKTCRDIKSRTDKSLVGTLYNGMLRKAKEDGVPFYETLKELHLPWTPPTIVTLDG